MKYELVKHEFKRTNRNFLITIVVLLAILAVSVILQAGELYNYIAGPFPVDAVSLQSMGFKEFSDKANPFSSISDEVYKTMSQIDIERVKAADYTIEDSALPTKAYRFSGNKYFGLLTGKPVQKFADFTPYVDFSNTAYAIVPYGDGLVLVKAADSDLDKGIFKGVFAPMTNSLEADIKPLIKAEYKDKIYPYVFFAEGSFESSALLDVLVLALFMAIIAFLTFRLVRRMINPKHHPLYKKLSMYGNPDEVITKLNEEYLLKESRIYKNEIATPSFIIRHRFWRTLVTLNSQDLR